MALPEATTSPALLERERELDAIRRVLGQSAQGSGGLLLVDGPAGVGKTALLDAARAAAGDAGLLVLRARGAELEQTFGFGVVRQLFDEVLRGDAFDRDALFAGAARFAGAALGIEGAAAAPAEDPYATRHAVYWLTANLAAQRPLAVLVDDAHWADSASLGVLAYLANRLDGIAAAVVIACRTEEPAAALDALRRQAGGHGTLLHVPALGRDAAAVVVRAFAPAADEALCRECHAASGGNPFLLRELARSLRSGASVHGHSPELVTREIGARLARLPEAAAAIARAVAVLGPDTPLRLAAALAGVDDDEAADAADALVEAGILAGAHPPEFLHPLVGAAVYAGLGAAARSRDHARAARLLDAEGAASERIAAQLLRCQPGGDAWAYERLVTAARRAPAPDAAAAYLQRALDEPAPPERRSSLLIELGAAEAHTDPAAAVTDLHEALAGDLPLEQRFRATMMLTGVLGQMGQAPEAADVLEEQFAAFADRPELRAHTEAALANITRLDPRTRPRARSVLAELRRRVEAGEEDSPVVLGTVAAEMALEGDGSGAATELAERALLGIEPTVTNAAAWSWYMAARTLMVGERYDAAQRHLDHAVEQARERGAVLDVGSALTFRSELFLHVGDLASAEVDARTLGEIAVVCGWTLAEGFSAAWLGDVLIDRNELDEAERVLRGRVPHVYSGVWLLLARGRLRLAQGRPADAADELRECGRRANAIGQISPAVVPWRSLLSHALIALGERAEARRLADEELELARRSGTPRAIGIALRAVARCERGEAEIARLHAAVEVLDGSRAALEQARAHADLGAALRRAGAVEDARESLRRAIELAHRCGATALEDEALGELRATGARPRRRMTTGAGALTPSERRIAELAAAGRQNREIAETLFVTLATVEFHLRNSYRKLGITSRTQLAEALR